jgi:hypothetical protein
MAIFVRDSKQTQTVAVVLSIQFYLDRCSGSPGMQARYSCDDCVMLLHGKIIPRNLSAFHSIQSEKSWKFVLMMKPKVLAVHKAVYFVSKKPKLQKDTHQNHGCGGECILLRKKIVKILHRVVHRLLH